MHIFVYPPAPESQSVCLLSVHFSKQEAVIENSTSPGTEIYQLTATDLDQQGTNNSAVIFDLVAPSSGFEIDESTGIISVSGTLSPQRQELVVMVADRGLPSLSSNYSIFVTVVSFNGYDPRFLDPTEFRFSENEIPTMAFSIFVEDEDIGLEGIVNLTLLHSDFSSIFEFEFSHGVNFTEGELTLMQEFDYENITNFTLIVQATDTGTEFFRRTSNQTYLFLISDENDNPPEFTGTPYHASVGEDATGGVVFFQASASDADSGTNAQVEFSLGLDGAGTFDIDPTSGNVSVVGTLLRAVTENYQLIIIATDQNGAGLSTNTTLNVTVLEVNDNAPMFAEDTPSNMTVLDDSPEGFFLLNISVSDADTGLPGTVDLSLEQEGQLFRLQGTSGTELHLNMTADLEVRTLHRFYAAVRYISSGESRGGGRGPGPPLFHPQRIYYCNIYYTHIHNEVPLGPCIGPLISTNPGSVPDKEQHALTKWCA